MDATFGMNFRGVGRRNTRDSLGLGELNGAAEKTGHHGVRLYFSQILAPANLFCNPECITKSIPIGSVKVFPTSCATSSRQPCWGMPLADSGRPTEGGWGSRTTPGTQDISRRRRAGMGHPTPGGIGYASLRGIEGVGVRCVGNGGSAEMGTVR